MSQLSILVEQRNAENEKDVRQIMKSLSEEQYDEERLARLICNSKEYENKHRGSRGNRNVLRACELSLLQLKKTNA